MEAVSPTCAICFAPLPSKHRRYCSSRCYGVARRKGLAAGTVLARFLEEELRVWTSSMQSQNSLARAIGISPASLTRYLQGHLPTDLTYGRLAEHFGPSLPRFATESDRRRDQARANVSEFGHLAHTPEAKARAAAARRHRPRPGQSEVMRARHREARSVGRGVSAGPQLTRFVQTPNGRARVSLGKFLQGTPQPTPTTIRDWAERVASRVGIPTLAVMACWGEQLRAAGLSTPGRPRLETRHRLVEDRLNGVRRNASSRLPQGFWKDAAAAVRLAEGNRITADALKQWWRGHLKRCVLSG